MEIRKLNTLRGIAALIVAVSHYSNNTNLLNGVLGHGGGQFGVMIFFILSGFLMSYLYMNKEFNKTEVIQFAVARVARVIPLFLIVVLCSYILISLGTKGILYYIPNEASLISHIAFLSGTSILWTIPAEIHFYVLFVFLWWLLQRKAAYVYIFLATAFLALVFLNFPRPEGNVFGIPFDIRLIRSLPYFFIGVVFGQLYGRWRPPNYLQSGGFVLALLLVLLLYPKIFVLIFGYKHGMWQDVVVLFSMSFIFFCLVFLVPDKNILLSNRFGDFLGKISYSLYLLHIPILMQLPNSAKEHSGIFLVIFLAAAISVSYLSYLLLENPFRKAIRSIATNRRLRTDTIKAGTD